MRETKYDCELIQDLLPLYQDKVCSNSSARAVEEHVKECDKCKTMLGQLNNYTVDDKISQEKNNILATHEKKEKKKTYMIGMGTACVLLVPTIICLICNIAIGHALDWFFIVLASMLVVASLLVVPFIVNEKRGVWTILSFTVALVILLLVCCIYTGGDWFFVAAVSCILGLSIVFAPYVICNLELPNWMQNKRGLTVMLWDTLWLYGVLVVAGIYVHGTAFYWRVSMASASYSLLLPWAIFLVVRYVKKNGFIKTGIVTIVSGTLFGLTNDVMSLLLGIPSESSLKDVDFTQGFRAGNLETLNANMILTVWLVALVIGVLLIGIGVVVEKERSSGKEKEM